MTVVPSSAQQGKFWFWLLSTSFPTPSLLAGDFLFPYSNFKNMMNPRKSCDGPETDARQGQFMFTTVIPLDLYYVLWQMTASIHWIASVTSRAWVCHSPKQVSSPGLLAHRANPTQKAEL